MQEIMEDVIRQAAQGDIQAFETVYKAASSFVYNVAYRVIGKREDAEEVTQEVFLTLYHKLKGFRFESSFKTWVYRITVNQAINMAKREAKTRDKMTSYDEQLEAPIISGGVQENIDREYHNKIIDDLLQGINPDQRACVVLRNMEGLSYEEIAKSLKININTVRSRLKRAREKLLATRKQVSYGHV